jgi:hypothetical protein
MKKVVRYTKEQIQAAHDLLKGKSGDRTRARMFHSFHDPENLYVKYTGFSMMEDGSVVTESVFMCVEPDGTISDCFKDLTMRQKLQFLVEAIEVDIDERGKMVMI